MTRLVHFIRRLESAEALSFVAIPPAYVDTEEVPPAGSEQRRFTTAGGQVQATQSVSPQLENYFRGEISGVV